ncbi:MAG: hypothetical protein LBB21_05690 [Holosporaceae bacterium]|jgi:hypothetical protein|nr:hypothetical protein [Holosporaceae bacterium]
MNFSRIMVNANKQLSAVSFRNALLCDGCNPPGTYSVKFLLVACFLWLHWFMLAASIWL